MIKASDFEKLLQEEGITPKKVRPLKKQKTTMAPKTTKPIMPKTVTPPPPRYINVPKFDVGKLIWRFAIAIMGMVAIYASYIIFYDEVWLSITSILVFMIQLSALVAVYDSMSLAFKSVQVEVLPEYVEGQLLLYRRCGWAVVAMMLIDLFPLYMTILGAYHPWYETDSLWEAVIFSIIPNAAAMFSNIWMCYLSASELFGWKKSKLQTIYDNFLATGMTEEELAKEEELKEYSHNSDLYGIGFRKIDDSFIYNDFTRNVFINGRKYSYAQIVGYTIEDNSYRRMSVTSKETTDPLNFLGRASIGDTLYGKAGAMMGGMTANRNVESEVYEHVTPCHTIFITVDSIFTHTEQLRIYNDTPKVREIESILRLITR